MIMISITVDISNIHNIWRAPKLNRNLEKSSKKAHKSNEHINAQATVVFSSKQMYESVEISRKRDEWLLLFLSLPLSPF